MLLLFLLRLVLVLVLVGSRNITALLPSFYVLCQAIINTQFAVILSSQLMAL